MVAALAQYGAYADSGPSQAELNAAGQSTEWLLPNHDYAGQRFVDLKQITRQNAADLRPVCIYQAGDVTPFQTNPLVYQGVMYVTSQFPGPPLRSMPLPVRCGGVTIGRPRQRMRR